MLSGELGRKIQTRRRRRAGGLGVCGALASRGNRGVVWKRSGRSGDLLISRHDFRIQNVGSNYAFSSLLILSILFHIPTDPRLTGNYARFRFRYRMGISYYHSMATGAVSAIVEYDVRPARLLSWVWERLEVHYPHNSISGRDRVKGPDTVMNAFLGVRCLRALIHPLVGADSCPLKVYDSTLPVEIGPPWSPLFVKCLESLPNLHTLEMGSPAGNYNTTPLKSALKGVELPKIKTPILPFAAHPLLQRCHNGLRAWA